MFIGKNIDNIFYFFEGLVIFDFLRMNFKFKATNIMNISNTIFCDYEPDNNNFCIAKYLQPN